MGFCMAILSVSRGNQNLSLRCPDGTYFNSRSRKILQPPEDNKAGICGRVLLSLSSYCLKLSMPINQEMICWGKE